MDLSAQMTTEQWSVWTAILYTVPSILCTVNGIIYTEYTISCRVYTVHCTLCSIQSHYCTIDSPAAPTSVVGRDQPTADPQEQDILARLKWRLSIARTTDSLEQIKSMDQRGSVQYCCGVGAGEREACNGATSRERGEKGRVQIWNYFRYFLCWC